jgi:hypothetical protein
MLIIEIPGEEYPLSLFPQISITVSLLPLSCCTSQKYNQSYEKDILKKDGSHDEVR